MASLTDSVRRAINILEIVYEQAEYHPAREKIAIHLLLGLSPELVDTHIRAFERAGVMPHRKKPETVATLSSMPYPDYLLTGHWQEVREKVLFRDGYMCMLCCSNQSLHVHHRTYEHRGEEQLHLRDLITLCEVCHTKFHGREAA